MTTTSMKVLLMCAAMAGVLCATTPPVLVISDGDGNIVTVDSTGTVTFSGSCNPGVTCTTLTSVASSGKISWTGSIGAFTISGNIGQTKPLVAPPDLDLSLSELTTSARGGTITIQWTDTNFNNSGPVTATMNAGGTISGTGSVTYNAYFDNNNTPFGIGIPVGNFGPVSTASFNGTINGPGATLSPYSMTQVVKFTLGPGSRAGGDFEVVGTPAACTGTIGDFVWSDTNDNGIQDAGELGINGVTVQLYQGPVAPANLLQTTITGPVPSGYTFLVPGTPGYYQFTGLCSGLYNVVVDSTLPANQPVLSGFIPSPSFNPLGTPATDSNGSPAQVNLPASDSVDETIDFGFYAPPPMLTCPPSGSSVGEVGVYFNSPPMMVTGGTPPYTFSVVGTLPPGLTLNPSTGAITGTPTAPGSFTIQVTDSLHLVASTSCPFIINPPPALTCLASGTTGEVGVPFNSPALTVTGGTAPYTFSVVGTLPAGLTLNSSTGAISGTPTAPGSFSIQVTDANGVTATTTCPYTITPPPTLTCLASGTTGLVGMPFSSAALTVAGGTAPYTFSVVGTLPAGLTLNPATGAISGTPTAPGSFSIKVTDANGVSAAGSCPYTIYPPVSATCVSITAVQGVAITPVTMTATGGAGGPYTFSASGLPNGLTMSSTGTISGMPTVSGTFPYTVTIKDAAGNIGTFNCSVTVNPPPQKLNLDCVTCSSIIGYVGKDYSASENVSGGVAPYTFSVVSGQVPPGMTLNTSTGVLSGTPTTPGIYYFTTKVVDSAGNSDTAICFIIILKSPVQLNCGACGSNPGAGQVGVTYTDNLTVSGGTAPYTFSLVSGSLPPGLTLNTSTGKITGVPTAAGTYTFTVKVVDAKGFSDTATCTIVVKAPIDLTCGACGSSAGIGQLGSSYTDTLAVTGGVAPFTFSIVSGSLPPGLTLNSSTGKISGIPTQIGTYTFTAKVVDSMGNSDTATCTIIIKGNPIDLQCGACGTGGTATVGQPYTDTLTVTNGTAPYTFSIISGSLPPGLTLNSSTGKISGSPTTAGTYTFTAKVVDYKGNSDTVSCTIKVTVAPLDVTCGTCTGTAGTAWVGTPYTDALVATGGAPSYTFSIVSGSLPPGLSLNTSTGAITGTPTTPGTYGFTAKVTDSLGHTDTATCAILVKASPIDLNCGACGGVNGKAKIGYFYSDQLTVTNGTAPYTFSLVSGTLPPGLSLNTSTGKISGTPTTSGTYTFTMKVVDAKGFTDTASCTVVVSKY